MTASTAVHRKSTAQDAFFILPIFLFGLLKYYSFAKYSIML